MAEKRPKIFIEVSCSSCGGVITIPYQNSKSIAKIKEYSKDWIFKTNMGKFHDISGNLCPNCRKKDPTTLFN